MTGLVVRIVTPPLKLSGFKLAAFDMDSTLINIECIDELADAAGKKAEVAAITEAAMRGEIADFKESLRRRLALLQGVPASALDEVYANRLRLNPGAQTLMDALHAAGLKTLLVSGGFTFFAEKVQARLRMHFMRSNVLEIVDGALTGKVLGAVVDRAAKEKYLREWAAAEGIALEHTIAVGDGANDLDMLGAAGIGVAFNAKPAVRAVADAALNMPYLDAVRHIAGV